MFDVAESRSHFPSLGKGQVFLDNAGGSQALGSVIDSIRDYLTNTNVQLGATYKTSAASTNKYNEAVLAGAGYINAQKDEVVYGPSTTQLFRNLSYALQFEPGDDIIVSALDHEANIAPWVDLAARQNLNLKWWKPPSPSSSSSASDDGDAVVDPRLRPEDLRSLLTPRTRLVTCTHASNILGTITDVRALADVIHANDSGALLCVDAVAYAPHRPIDIAALGVDFYAFSWYKVYGPHIAMLYGSRRAQRSGHMRSLGHYFKPQDGPGASLEDRLGLAGASYELLQAVPRVVEYLTRDPNTWSAVASHEAALQRRLLAYLLQRQPERKPRPAITVYGSSGADPAERVPTISFTVQGWGSRALVEAVESRRPDLGFRWGAFYSNRLAEEILGLGPEGVVRVSMVHYNTS